MQSFCRFFYVTFSRLFVFFQDSSLALALAEVLAEADGEADADAAADVLALAEADGEADADAAALSLAEAEGAVEAATEAEGAVEAATEAEGAVEAAAEVEAAGDALEAVEELLQPTNIKDATTITATRIAIYFLFILKFPFLIPSIIYFYKIIILCSDRDFTPGQFFIFCTWPYNVFDYSLQCRFCKAFGFLNFIIFSYKNSLTEI